jgi:hypothetical protein
MVESAIALNADMLPLKKWLREIGVAASTAWRWRREGLLKTINIYGRIYVTRKAREEFLARAEAGEFAQEPVTPKRSPVQPG